MKTFMFSGLRRMQNHEGYGAFLRLLKSSMVNIFTWMQGPMTNFHTILYIKSGME